MSFIRNKGDCEVIPPEILDSEVLARGIIAPFHYSRSGKKLHEKIFLPPLKPEPRNDISTLRANFTTIDFIKRHAQSLVKGGGEYKGVLVINVGAIKSFQRGGSIKYPEEEFIDEELRNTSITIDVIFTPLDQNKQIVNKRPICKNDIGLPCHADLIYPGYSPIIGTPHPIALRKFAKLLAKAPYTIPFSSIGSEGIDKEKMACCYFIEEDPASTDWTSGDIYSVF